MSTDVSLCICICMYEHIRCWRVSKKCAYVLMAALQLRVHHDVFQHAGLGTAVLGLGLDLLLKHLVMDETASDGEGIHDLSHPPIA